MSKPVIVAHRGIHHEHPENSTEALLAAWNAGVVWCECDVRGSSECEPFLLHDGTLERTSDGSGMIENTGSDAISRLKLRREDGSISNCHVPRLETVIRAMPAGAKFLIEIKPKVLSDVVRRTLDLCNPATCIVQSFDADILHQSARLRPEVERMYLVDDVKDAAKVGPPAWSQVNARFNSLNEGTVEMIRSQGLRIGAWTPNEQADIQRMLELNLDMIISDRPLAVGRLADLRDIG